MFLCNLLKLSFDFKDCWVSIMKIEVAVSVNVSTKDRGDLLENISKKLLEAQSYNVIQEIRFTAVELDLLCKHKVSGKEIYVECKAHRGNIDSNVLKNLLGTLTLQEYSEAWIISTAEFGKEAKGFIETWKAKPASQSMKLSFYSPDMVLDSLIGSGVIRPRPQDAAVELVGGLNNLGEWTLLITQYGNFWLVSKISGGVPTEILSFYASNNEPVIDLVLLKNLNATDSTLSSMNFVPAEKSKNAAIAICRETLVDVVQIQSGETWSDYRPSRPQDFVGRVKDQNSIFAFFKNIINRETKTRIFAFTGNSGVGKSSLIAKIADRSKGAHNRKHFFIFPVDVRAATTPSYIYSALLRCLVAAQLAGFGDKSIVINVTDASNPLNSTSVRDFLISLEKSRQLIVLMLDQFEELYTKPELYHVFDRAKSLLIAAAALNGSFCLGFAWKSDSTTHNEHPAYFFWHELADFRLTRKLSPFSDQESATVVNIFEKEIGQKLNNDLRHNLLVGSQGYPWLLKKLCIHLYDKIQSGSQQEDLLENKLDVKSLFDADLNQLSMPERSCLDFVAKRAPVDWFEVIEMSSVDVLNSLINRRLVIRSGDRLNAYWDIFREYLLTQKVPVIPLRYLPSTDFSSVLAVVGVLSRTSPISIGEISKITGFKEGTVQNIGTDINMFGIAVRVDGGYLLAQDIDTMDSTSIVKKMREKFKRHAFTIELQDRSSSAEIVVSEAVVILKEIFLNNSYAENTWNAYTQRLCRWLEICGFLMSTKNGWIYRDKGDVVSGLPLKRRKSLSSILSVLASPATTADAMRWIIERKSISKIENYPKGYRNAVAILRKFNLISVSKGCILPNTKELSRFSSIEDAIFASAEAEPSLNNVMCFLEKNKDSSSESVGLMVSNALSLEWSVATQKRMGGAMRNWAMWVMSEKDKLINPPLFGLR